MRYAAAALGVLLLATGCGQATPAGRATGTLVMDDFSYDPVQIVVPAGQAGYVLTLVNRGTVPHDMTVDGLPDEVPVHLALLPGGEVPYALPPLPAGTYEVYCALEGHRELGMEAELVVA